MSSLVVTLRFNIHDRLIFQSFSGFSVRGFFYELLKSISPDLANSIHAGGALAPFSTSPLFITSGDSAKVVWKEASAPSIGFVKLSLLDDDLSKVFGQLLLGGGLREVVLSGKKMPTTEIGVQEVRFERLLEHSQPISRIRVRFRTPTYFRRPLHMCCAHCPLYRSALKAKAAGVEEEVCPFFELEKKYRFIPLPEPTLLFRSLIRLWRKFSDVRMDYDGFMEWVEGGGIAISGYPRGLRTFRVYEHPHANKWVVGFTGTAYYNLPKDSYDERYARLCDSLLRFGEISNVGGGRTAGLGMIEYEPLVPPTPSREMHEWVTLEED